MNRVATLLLAASCSASCFESIPPGKVLFDVPLGDLVRKSVPVPFQGKPSPPGAQAASRHGPEDGGRIDIVFHGDYHGEVRFPRDQCGPFLDKVAGLLSQHFREKGANASGTGSYGNESRTVEYSRGLSSGSIEIFCLGGDSQMSHVVAVVDEVVLRGRG